jgi:hypothetical protein
MTPVQTAPTPVEGGSQKAQLSPLIRLDLFPAVVRSPDNSVLIAEEKARVIVTTDAVFVFKDSPQGPAVALKARLSSARGDRKAGYTLTFMPPHDPESDAPRALATVKVTPSGNCGCGSRLRSFTPFTPMRYTNPGPNLQ